MSTLYNKTDNYALSLYGDNDPADLRDGYNSSMHTIDTTMETHLNRIEGVEARETQNEAVTKALLGDNTVDSATASKSKWDKASTDADADMRILAALGATSEKAASNIGNGTKYILETYKADGDFDYTNAWNKILSEMEYGGTIVFPSNTVATGTFIISKRNVRITNAILASPIIVDVAATNDDQDGVLIEKCRFTGDYGIELRRGVGTTITNNTFSNSRYAIYVTVTPQYQQQVRQTIITNNSIYTEDTGVYVKPAVSNSNYVAADWIISNNQINTLVENIHVEDADGVNITNNVCFLSLGTSAKKNNICLDNCSYSIVADNELFEAGASGIYTNDVNRVKIDNNQIVWPGQYLQVAGIRAEVATKSADRYYTITNNTIENPTNDGIYTNAELCTIANNQIQYPGSKDHWLGGGDLTGTSYGINAVGTHGYYNIKGNYTIGNSSNNVPKLQGVSDNVIYTTQLDYSASNYSTYYKYFPHFVSRAVSTKDEIVANKYSQGQITNFIVQSNHVTVTASEFLSNINIGWGPLIAIVSCYNGGSLDIGSITIPENTSKMLLLYASTVREL
ncbi:MAG: right-handed parallel beta-helix repeat-containing protein [Escherichia coli]|nr:right-handed parallel beta-helix repeat-containing protein [Escherichia coli]MBL0973458.1 right-handed parallel beta-helix repeat-containing protein [Escherichia coli]